jgi:hypothetical protein
MFSLFRERKVVETNYLRPRFKPSEQDLRTYPNMKPLKALITTEGENKGHLCWGIVDPETDEYVDDNQQLRFNPWTGAPLPLTLDALKRQVNYQARSRGANAPFPNVGRGY